MSIIYEISYEESRKYSIPAYKDNSGNIIIGHNNDSSAWLPYPYIPEGFDINTIKHIVDNIYLISEHYYEFTELRDGQTDKLVYTYLWSCSYKTQICICKDCGKIFAVTGDEYFWYIARLLNVPNVRCKECIKKRKK